MRQHAVTGAAALVAALETITAALADGYRPLDRRVFAPLRDRLDPIRQPFVGPNTVGNSWTFLIGVLVVAVGFGLLYPQVMGPFGAQQFALYFAYVLLGLSLALVWGYGGILSFGQVAFYGIAGYAFGVITLNVGSPLGITLGLLGSVGVGALAALLLGYFMFYGGVSEVYVTIMTLVVTMGLHTFMAQTAGAAWTIGEAALGGKNGMPGIPALALGVGPASIEVSGVLLFWLLLAVTIGSYLALRVLVNSRFGRVAVAVREDPDRTEMFGYDVKRVKLAVFTVGGSLAAAGGVFYTTWGSYINPDVFSLTFATLPVIWVSVGGRKTLLGAVVGTLAIAVGQDWLASMLSGSLAFVLVGLVLVGTILFFPRGAIPGLVDLFGWTRHRLPHHVRQLPAYLERGTVPGEADRLAGDGGATADKEVND